MVCGTSAFGTLQAQQVKRMGSSFHLALFVRRLSTVLVAGHVGGGAEDALMRCDALGICPCGATSRQHHILERWQHSLPSRPTLSVLPYPSGEMHMGAGAGRVHGRAPCLWLYAGVGSDCVWGVADISYAGG
jgi:hypothetical protein